MQISTIGFDIAKKVFQVHGIDAAEKVVVRKQLRRGQVLKFFASLSPCLVRMEACASAHYWARELRKLGHELRLMPAKDVKAYVKRNKNDAVGPISKQGDRYLRRILVVGAHSVLRRAKLNPEKYPWLTQLLARRPFKVAAVALANKMARIAWALLASAGVYRAPRLAAA